LRNPEHYLYDLNIADIAEVWRRGSVVSSWLLDLAAISLLESRTWRSSLDVSRIQGKALDDRRGHRRVGSCARPQRALYERFSSRGEDDFAEKVLSALRYQFGGHDEKAAAAGQARDGKSQSDALVIFGVTGDLAHKMIFPALYAMVKRGALKVPVIGVAFPKWSLARLHRRVTDSIERAAESITNALFNIFSPCSSM